MAVAVAPDVNYVRARLDGEMLIVAAPLLERVLGEEAEVLDTFPGSDLVGRRYRGPVFDLTDRERGRVPGDRRRFRHHRGRHRPRPHRPGLRRGRLRGRRRERDLRPDQAATLYNPVPRDGKFDDRVVGFEGSFVKDPEVTRRLIDDLAERGLLFREQVYEHAYPHCWRCGTPLLYYAKSSWYVATSRERDGLLANNEQIGWHPEHIKHGRFGKWLENNVDWALSRDRYWGTPLPIWECGGEGCDERACIGSVAELRERAGGEVPDDLHRPYIDEVVLPCESCGGEMRRVESVIDTWYDSGAMPFAQFHYPFENEEQFEERFPADFICEAIDQTRGWFYTLLAESTLLFDTSSYRNCVCLGLILDPEGQKMSKSRGNVVEPWDVISAHGADAFRWYYLTSQQPWSGYRFSVETVGESVRQFLLTLWNTYSFWVLYANAEGLGPADFAGAAEAAGNDLDRWCSRGSRATIARVTELMDEFDCTAAGREIAAFVEELSNWYVRLSRRRFWDGDRAAFATLRHCLLETAALLAPFTPFLADEIHLNLAGGEGEEFGALPDSVHLRDYPEPDPALADPDLESAMEAVRLTVELGRAARAQAKAKVRQPLRRAVIVANDAEREAISARADLVTAELNVKELDFVSEEAELVSYSVKPNYRALGPRFGKRMPQVAAAIEALDPEHVADGDVGRRRDRDQHRRRRAHDQPRRGDPRAAAARGLRGRGRGRPRGRAPARARRRAAPRGPRPRDRPRGAERAQRGGARDHRPDRADPRRRRRTCSRPPASTRTTSPARSSPPRSPTTAARRRRGDDRRPRPADRRPGPSRRAQRPSALASSGSPMMKSDFAESENFTQQCSGGTPATSISADSIRFAISAFCSSVRPSYQWMWTKGMCPAYASAGSSSASRRRFGIAPTTFFAIAPSLNRSRVGIERTSYSAAVCWFSSTLRLRIVRSSRSASISSRTGWTTRHGPHQGAQKSTRTGPSASSTSDLKVASVTSVSLPVTEIGLLGSRICQRSILQKV